MRLNDDSRAIKVYDAADISCPSCGQVHNCAMSVEDLNAGRQFPMDGDIGVCIRCAGVFEYVYNGRVLTARAFSQDRIDTLDEETRKVITRARYIIRRSR